MYYLKFLYVFVAIWSAVESGCPSMCTCSSSSILCIQKNLESIPNFDSLQNNPLIIDLSGNKINLVDNDDFSFEHNYGVKEIYLNNSELLEIESEAFDELENLQELYLAENLLDNLPSSLIEDLPNMILLDISRNHFAGDMPLIRSESLEVLAIANSKITTVPLNSLKYLSNLKMLLLQQNNIQTMSISVFDNISKTSLLLKLFYNPWDCSCENVELFTYLDKNRFIDKLDPYQCRTNKSKTIDIFEERGMSIIRNKCLPNSDGNISFGTSEKSYSLIKDDNKMNERDVVESQKNHSKCQTVSDKFLLDFDKNHLEFIILMCTFFLGLLVGFCVNQIFTITRYNKLYLAGSKSKLYTP